jgi:arabinose-5-phosphate isomerase
MEVRQRSSEPAWKSVRISAAAEMLRRESAAISRLASELGEAFSSAVDRILACPGQVVVSGMGKAGLIGQKISATLASTGTRSFFLHPAEAVHGDLGRVGPDDLMLLLSYSGETEELTRLLPLLRSQAAGMIAITRSRTNTLASYADVLLELGDCGEACPLGLAPSTSTTAMLALGDALALSVSRERGFTRDHFARFHPAGNLGRQLTPVDQVMRPLSQCRVASSSLAVCEALVAVSQPGRRSGAVLLVDPHGTLVGIFTDSDLARLLESRRRGELDQPISRVMTSRFRTIASGARLSEAIRILAAYKISELPVVDERGRALGLIDITDVMSLVSLDADAFPPTGQGGPPTAPGITHVVAHETARAPGDDALPVPDISSHRRLGPDGELISVAIEHLPKPKG